MVDLRIDQLPAADPLDGSELVPAMQGGQTVHTSAAALVAPTEPVDLVVGVTTALALSDWGTKDPAKVPLRVLVNAGSTITLPPSAPVGTRVEVHKAIASSYTLTVAAPSGETVQASASGTTGTSVTTGALVGVYAFVFTKTSSDTWTCPGGTREGSIIPQQLQVSAHSLVIRNQSTAGPGISQPINTNALVGRFGTGTITGPTVAQQSVVARGAGNLEAMTSSAGTAFRRTASGDLGFGKIDDDVCSFGSPGGAYLLASVAPGSQDTGSIPNLSTFSTSFTPSANNRIYRTVWCVRLRIASVDYIADQLVISKRDGSGNVSILERRDLTDVPSGVFFDAATDTGDVVLEINNETGGTIEAATAFSHLVEVL